MGARVRQCSVDSEHFARLSEQLLGQGLTVRFVVQGDSMRPFLSGGATVGIAPIVQPPEVGSVVLCKFENRVLLHRVQEVHRDPSGGSVLAVTVRGDAETPGDEDASQRVPAKDVLGVLTDAHAAAESALQRIRTWLKRLAR